MNHTKWVLQKIPSECLWCERWPVWGYVDVESAQSSFLWGLLFFGKFVLFSLFKKLFWTKRESVYEDLYMTKMCKHIASIDVQTTVVLVRN